MTESNETAAADTPDATVSWRRYLFPQFPAGSWASRCRWLGVRVVVYYVLLVVSVMLFQRSLIYLPRQVDRITAKDAVGATDRTTDIETIADDGQRLRGWRIRSERQPPLGVVVFLHGNGGDRTNRVADAGSFNRLGLDVVLFDYRGYGDNPGHPTETNLGRDARAMWRYAVDELSYAPEHVFLYGESIGGAVAVRLCGELCREGDAPGGIILFGTFSSMSEAGSAHYPWLPVDWLLWDRFQSDEHIRSVTCPIVQVHGERDRIVPFQLGKKLFESAPEVSSDGVSKRFVPIPNGGHNDIAAGSFATIVDSFLKDALTGTRKGE